VKTELTPSRSKRLATLASRQYWQAFFHSSPCRCVIADFIDLFLVGAVLNV